MRDLALESFVLRPGARSYDTEALAADLAGASFEPKPRKPAESTLKKESAETRAEHIARAEDRLASAVSALHPAAAELAAGSAPPGRGHPR